MISRALFVVLIAFSPALVLAQERAEQQIREALEPLPPQLRDGTTVVLGQGPERRLLREGTNDLICRADSPAPGFMAHCHHKDLDSLFSRMNQLYAQGKSSDEVRDQVSAEIESGELAPPLAGATEYILLGRNLEGALPIMTVSLPNATAESTGLPTERDSYRPWLMWAGTPLAHIMLPGN
ncbi:MAG: hypothetical protein V3V67_13695 [Myxococcota bacterium]